MLVTLLLVVILAGLALWALARLPLDPTLLQIARVIVIVAVVVYAIRLLFPGRLPF